MERKSIFKRIGYLLMIITLTIVTFTAPTILKKEINAAVTPDTTAPVIDPVAGATIDTDAAATWTEPTATANDNIDGEISNLVVVKYFEADGTELADVDAARAELIAGITVVVKYNVSDTAGNVAEITVIFTANDNTAPVINSRLYDGVNTENASTWFALATARDNKDGDISNLIVVKYFDADGTIELGDLDAARAELYEGRRVTVKYNVSDEAGNAATETTEITIVNDNTEPVWGDYQYETIVNREDISTWEAPVMTVNDNVDGDISSKVVVTYLGRNFNVVDLATARTELEIGIYVEYFVEDAAKNFIWTLVYIGTNREFEDTTAPVINPAANALVNTEDASSWITPTATANDTEDGDISDDIKVTYYKADGTVLSDEEAARTELAVVGNKVIVKYNVSDEAGNAATEVTATFTANDNTAPVINPIANALVNTEDASTWTAPIATANDNIDGDISNLVVVKYFDADGTIELVDLYAARAELYDGRSVAVKYNVSNEAGNVAEITVIFTANDNTEPVLWGIDYNDLIVNIEDISTWTAPVIRANDNVDGDISSKVVVTYLGHSGNVVDLATARAELEFGIEVLYIVEDAAKNSTRLYSFIKLNREVEDTTAPVINPVANALVNTEDASTWTAPIATANDNKDGDISNLVEVTYYKADGTTSIDLTVARAELTLGNDVVVKYNVSNEAGNRATEVSATFTAFDITAPVIDPVADGTVNTEDALTWTAPIATAYDNKDGNISNDIEVKYFDADGTELADVDAARAELIAGITVVIKYNVSDTAGNAATEVSATFTAFDITAPVIEPLYDATVETGDAATWTEPTATANDNKDGIISNLVKVKYFKADGTSLANLAAARTELAAGRNVVVSYSIIDEAGNKAKITVTFTANDNTAPIIEPVADAPINPEDVSTWIPPIATANDNVDGEISSSVEIKYFDADGTELADVDAARTELVAGKNVVVKYSVSDAVGNAAEVSATFTSEDKTAPTITSSSVNFNLNYTLTANEDIVEYSIDNGLTWIQLTTPSESVSIKLSRSGIYSIIVKDEAGNESSMRTVFIFVGFEVWRISPRWKF